MTAAPSRFFGNTVALVVATVLATALTLAQMKILAAHLPLAIFGLFASLRGLSLLVSMLAANGFPQFLVRFIPEHAARGARGAAARLSVLSVCATVALCSLLLAGVALFAGLFFRQVPVDEPRGPLLWWFALTTLGVALKLVLYGGFNGLRRFGSQTVFETLSLGAQVTWMALVADSLTLTRLFEITGVTSVATVVVAVPWFARSLSNDVAVAAPGNAGSAYGRYWVGALGLSIVALAFTDVDRWVLSNVLALESLSLFHVASRISRMANRFIAIPVLAFQPEATRVHAEGRRGDLRIATHAFFKASVILAVLAAIAIMVYSGPLVLLASNREFMGARTTLCLLAAAVPLAAMTAPLTAVMKALDGVRAALYCDLAWAGVYLLALVVLTRPLGVEGTGVAQLAACTVQVFVAFRLATLRPEPRAAAAVLGKSLACGAGAFLPVVIVTRLGLPLAGQVLFAVPSTWLYLRLVRWSGVLSDEERERLQNVIGARRAALLAGWMP
ncbi:MAG TPA: lipopolysaccharide biosynthesis protein [Candidatus Krumholzibacteria bacterium]|nr:lipopolysaccharide biosynthesis protein [Candidatus Krumholzibacteria bacterium]